MSGLEKRLCECGCGQPTRRYNQTKRKRGIVKGEFARFLHGHNSSREPKGWTRNVHGYILRRIGPRRWKYEHRLVMEEHLGRALRPGEVVHHRDGNKDNNTLENLELLDSPSTHARLHADMRAAAVYL